MIRARDVYDRVCNVLLEPGGLQLGLLTEAEFLKYLNDVAADFLKMTSLTQTIECLEAQQGVQQYALQDWGMEPLQVLYNEKALFRDDEADRSLSTPRWRTAIGEPKQWSNDKMTQKTIEISPAPQLAGNPVVTDQGVPFYGTLGAWVDGDFALTVTQPIYGVIGSQSVGPAALGDNYIDAPGALLGTIAQIAEALRNLAAIVTTGLWRPIASLDDFAESIPASFLGYVSYGVLAKVFSQDGELKDDGRALYCAARYGEGISLAAIVSQEALMQEND